MIPQRIGCVMQLLLLPAQVRLQHRPVQLILDQGKRLVSLIFLVFGMVEVLARHLTASMEWELALELLDARLTQHHALAQAIKAHVNLRMILMVGLVRGQTQCRLVLDLMSQLVQVIQCLDALQIMETVHHTQMAVEMDLLVMVITQDALMTVCLVLVQELHS